MNDSYHWHVERAAAPVTKGIGFLGFTCAILFTIDEHVLSKPASYFPSIHNDPNIVLNNKDEVIVKPQKALTKSEYRVTKNHHIIRKKKVVRKNPNILSRIWNTLK